MYKLPAPCLPTPPSECCWSCYKTHLKNYGGYGFGNVLNSIVPRFLLKGVSRKDIDTMLIDNPRRLFS